MAQGIFLRPLYLIEIRNSSAFSSGDTNTSCSESAGNPLDEMRSIIDREIARLQENIRALKSRRNELSPISRLPTERNLVQHILSRWRQHLLHKVEFKFLDQL